MIHIKVLLLGVAVVLVGAILHRYIKIETSRISNTNEVVCKSRRKRRYGFISSRQVMI
jgi:hypothetical protein